jgi:hypothetical protein
MDISNKLNLALTRCGYHPLQTRGDFNQVGAGAWHDAYKVQPHGQAELVVRLRKQVIYGQTEVWDAQTLHEDYAPVGLYYQVANRAHPGVCPAIYDYRIDPDLTFTIESFLPGRPLPLDSLSIPGAVEIGQALGEFFRNMHSHSTTLPGHGDLTWSGGQITAARQVPAGQIWQGRRAEYQAQLEALTASALEFNRARINQKFALALESRNPAADPVALVNQDITPENLLVYERRWVGLVDPVPALDNGTYYAAWFTHCYRLFLPTLSNAPRYVRHNFRARSTVLSAIADGFTSGYCQHDPLIFQDLRIDEFFWALDLAHENYELLRNRMNPEMRLRRGTPDDVAGALQRALQTLQKIDW